MGCEDLRVMGLAWTMTSLQHNSSQKMNGPPIENMSFVGISHGSWMVLLVFGTLAAMIVNLLWSCVRYDKKKNFENNENDENSEPTFQPIESRWRPDRENPMVSNPTCLTIKPKTQREQESQAPNWRCPCENSLLPPGLQKSFGMAEAMLRMGAGQCYHKKI